MLNTNFVNKKVVPLGCKKGTKCLFLQITDDMDFVKVICPTFARRKSPTSIGGRAKESYFLMRWNAKPPISSFM